MSAGFKAGSSTTSSPVSSSSASSHSRDLSHLLSGQSPAQLLADIEARELQLRRMHRILAQEQQRVKQEEGLIRDKLQQHASPQSFASPTE